MVAHGRPASLDPSANRPERVVENGSDGDVLLYNAYRDLFPPRVVRHPSGEGRTEWRSDLVEYNSGVLPSGEPVRSIGHRNPPDQIEMFQILKGAVILVVAGQGAERERKAFVASIRAQDFEIVILPPGAWHVTYVLRGPALVFNIYNAKTVPSGSPSPAVESKYRHSPPIKLSISPKGETFVALEALAPHAAAHAEAFLASRRFCDTTGGLVEMIVGAPDEVLVALENDIREAFAAGWPLDEPRFRKGFSAQ
jgi:hypothetical protein